MNFKLTKSMQNIPLLEVNNFCCVTGAEFDVEENEAVLVDIKEEKPDKASIRQRMEG